MDSTNKREVGIGRKRVLILAILAPFFFAFLIFVGQKFYSEWEDPIGFRNSKVCPGLKPGITIDETKSALGEPVMREEVSDHKVWVFFKTPSIAAGPIRALVDKPTGKILTLRCNEDGPPTWTFSP